MSPKPDTTLEHLPVFNPSAQCLSDETIARNWTLTQSDRQVLKKYRKNTRLYMAIQLCALRLYNRFLDNVNTLSVYTTNYLAEQLQLPPSWQVQIPLREATHLEQRQHILKYLGFSRLDETKKQELIAWLKNQAKLGMLPETLVKQAESYLSNKKILLPGASRLKRIVFQVCFQVHVELFEAMFQSLSPQSRQTIDHLLEVQQGEQRSYFHRLKEYPPAATLSSIKAYLERYQILAAIPIDQCQGLSAEFLTYLFKQAKGYNAMDMKRFAVQKRYALMMGFILETRKILLDHLVAMHDQYMLEICRRARNAYEKHHRALRKRQKKAIDRITKAANILLAWPEEEIFSQKAVWDKIDPVSLRSSLEDLDEFQKLEENGYVEGLLTRYASLRRYFTEFVELPFVAERGNEPLIKAIEILLKLNKGLLKRMPADAPTGFVPKELRKLLRDATGKINRPVWEMALALALKDALRAGNIYLPQSKQYVSFWNLTLNESSWQEQRVFSFSELEQPEASSVKTSLIAQFCKDLQLSEQRFEADEFAQIEQSQLKLKRQEKVEVPREVVTLQKIIDARLPSIRIEELLVQVDEQVEFSTHFSSSHHHQAQPRHFYRTLMAAIISQATNLGIVAMSSSVANTTIDMLRHVLRDFIREETLIAANRAIVEAHHQLPLSALYGSGHVSSSDAQRFGIRPSSLLASYYPRYYGYYEKAVSIYTHVSDQYAVFNTQVISCGPREALYVLDGLLNNNTILPLKEHTTDTHGYTEIIFALCHVLGFYFMPRIRDLKDQQLYKVHKEGQYGIFTPLLTKTVNLELIEEQWEAMIRVAISLKRRTAPAHVIVQRLSHSSPADRLSQAFTHLGRIIKTQYILRYLTDRSLREKVQLQLNKGEYRHKLPRRIFFADQGEFTTGNYQEIMNKASCLSLVSNAVLYWNTIKINEIIESLRTQGEAIARESLSHISLLPYKHVLPNGTYFIADK